MCSSDLVHGQSRHSCSYLDSEKGTTSGVEDGEAKMKMRMRMVSGFVLETKPLESNIVETMGGTIGGARKITILC